ncbi:hypothetical protein KUCAC02_028199 [Chaenocephalus aceratus]|uniref:Uncharacterized protein n=1 Tax=Chaenocephalus aceratus TaxID=36190 RepID=A0ACB9X157_CHAAC|nr:hypothetical protein KUCAC02_028199 [Chaenocephalus aceratus]
MLSFRAPTWSSVLGLWLQRGVPCWDPELVSMAPCRPSHMVPSSFTVTEREREEIKTNMWWQGELHMMNRCNQYRLAVIGGGCF